MSRSDPPEKLSVDELLRRACVDAEAFRRAWLDTHADLRHDPSYRDLFAGTEAYLDQLRAYRAKRWPEDAAVAAAAAARAGGAGGAGGPDAATRRAWRAAYPKGPPCLWRGGKATGACLVYCGYDCVEQARRALGAGAGGAVPPVEHAPWHLLPADLRCVRCRRALWWRHEIPAGGDRTTDAAARRHAPELAARLRLAGVPHGRTPEETWAALAATARDTPQDAWWRDWNHTRAPYGDGRGQIGTVTAGPLAGAHLGLIEHALGWAVGEFAADEGGLCVALPQAQVRPWQEVRGVRFHADGGQTVEHLDGTVEYRPAPPATEEATAS